MDFKERRASLIETWAALSHQLEEAEGRAAQLRLEKAKAMGAIEELDNVRQIVEPENE